MVSDTKRRKINLGFYWNNQLKINLFAFTPSDIIWNKRSIRGLQLIDGGWRERTFPIPHAIYNRCYNNEEITISRLDSMIGRNICFNTINHFNKWNVYKLLNNTNIKTFVPETFLFDEI